MLAVELIPLSDRDIDIICKYYAIGQERHTLQKLGDIYGVSRERIRQIKNKVLEKIGSWENIYDYIKK